MRISDWSSDVCSSDLIANDKRAAMNRRRMPGTRVQSLNRSPRVRPGFRRLPVAVDAGRTPGAGAPGTRVGDNDARVRAETARRDKRSEERRVGKECVSRVDLGGRRIIKKKIRKNPDMQRKKDIVNQTHTRKKQSRKQKIRLHKYRISKNN